MSEDINVIDTIIMEDTGVGDVAMQPARVMTKPDSECRGMPCFDIDDSHEFHSFSKGIKTFHRWKQHTKSENIRQWARQNGGKDFYVHNGGNYMLVKRSKARGM